MTKTKQNNPPREEERPISVEFSNDMLRITLKDGREIATPLSWYPRLEQASDEQRANVELSISGIYWPDLDEDLSIAGMLRGVQPPQPRKDTIS